MQPQGGLQNYIWFPLIFQIGDHFVSQQEARTRVAIMFFHWPFAQAKSVFKTKNNKKICCDLKKKSEFHSH